MATQPTTSELDLGWLLNLRAVASVVLLVVAIPAVWRGWLALEHVPAYLAVLGGLVLHGLWARHRSARPHAVPATLAVDLLAVVLVLGLTGGARNPLAELPLVHGCLGAMLLPAPLALVFVLLVAGALVALELFPVLPPAAELVVLEPGHLAARLVLLTVLSGLVYWLAARSRREQAQVLALTRVQGRLERLGAVGALSTGFAHRLATPLQVLEICVQRLTRTLDDDHEDRIDAMDALAKCTVVLREMTAEIPTAGLRPRVVVVGDLVERICGAWRGDGQAVVVEVQAPELRAALPELAFAQSLVNLLDNALQAAPDGPIEVWVSREGDGVRITVADRGPGWDPAVRERLGSPRVSTKSEGAGLGLYNAGSLALALGGSLHFGDRPGGGALASFVLPSVASV